MCGIIAYLGNRQVYPILIECLKYLEYRGYDSAGISILQDGYINTIKSVGKLNNLVSKISNENLNVNGTIGIGHNRWATHGNVTIENTHPHISRENNFSLVHNGIIENYKVLRDILEKRGYIFTSQTDTETIVHLVDNIKNTEDVTLDVALQKAIKQIIGAYAIVILNKDEQDTLLVAKNSSPLIIGFNNDYSEYIVASDIKCISQYVTNVIYLEDKHVAKLIKGKSPQIYNPNDELVTPFIEELQLEIQLNDKNGYEHYLLKEIYEQPMSIVNSIRGRINSDTWRIKLGGLYNSYDTLVSAKTFTFIGCGTSFHACLIAEYLFESILRIPCKAVNASEYRYKNPIVQNNEIVIAISQSGETADTLAALKLAKQNEAYTLGICNVTSSSIARATHCGCYIHAGPEVSVASTKAFTSQICILLLIILYIKSDVLLSIELYNIPGKILNVLDTQEKNIRELAHKLYTSEHILFLGRGILYPVALESALKFKELTYIHAEAILTSELKHGPLAMIDENIPIIIFANRCSTYEKTLNSIEEIRSRSGNIFLIKTDSDDDLICDNSISVPNVNEYLLPFVTIVPIQLLAYHIALLRKINIDTPRNIAKSVTVE